eukprot:scaffold476008_cov38-Prasinocladus_malaysianus.AAC.1
MYNKACPGAVRFDTTKHSSPGCALASRLIQSKHLFFADSMCSDKWLDARVVAYDVICAFQCTGCRYPAIALQLFMAVACEVQSVCHIRSHAEFIVVATVH